MTVQAIVSGVTKLMEENHYSGATIKTYTQMWDRLSNFLLEQYGDTEFDMERGLAFLEQKYEFQTKYDEGSLSQAKVQLLRMINILEDYRLYGVLVRRYFNPKNPVALTGEFEIIHEKYSDYLKTSPLSTSTVNHYLNSTRLFLNCVSQSGLAFPEQISTENVNCYIKTLAGYSYKTVEQEICGIRHFLRFLLETGIITNDLASEIHMPVISKTASIPSAWSTEELKSLVSAIDRTSPIGKRDYAMIIIASCCGLRGGDIKNLRFGNFNWEEKTLSFVQHKTKKPLTLPLPDAIGWAVIDYIKNGRPKYYDTDYVFIKHMPPFSPLGDDNHLDSIVTKYMNKAGIRRDRHQHSGFHSLRHSCGTMLMDMEIPVHVIAEVLGHSDIDVTGIYLKTHLKKLAECVLPLNFDDGDDNDDKH